jgi:hypothetical protein
MRGAALVLLGSTLAAGAARADDRLGIDTELNLDLETGWARFLDDEDRVHHGIFGGLDAAYVFAPFWAVRGGYTYADHHAKGENFQVHQISAGARYRLDVFEYVPWIEISPAVFFSSGGSGPSAFDAGVEAGLGIDWLLGETWSVGMAARYFRLFGEEQFPAYLLAGLRIGYRWTIGDPFAP